MRGTTLPVAALVATVVSLGLITPVLAQGAKVAKHVRYAPGPTWQQCYNLGWDRGVHVELGELPDWMKVCLAGEIPFDNREPGIAARAQAHR